MNCASVDPLVVLAPVAPPAAAKVDICEAAERMMFVVGGNNTVVEVASVVL